MSADLHARIAAAVAETRAEIWPRRDIQRRGTCDGCDEIRDLVAAYDDPEGNHEPWLCVECAKAADFILAACDHADDVLARHYPHETRRDYCWPHGHPLAAEPEVRALADLWLGKGWDQ